MNKMNTTERGQVLVIIALAMIGLIGITGLAIDGSIVLSDRRQAQNAADTAAMAGALAKVKPQTDEHGTVIPWDIVALNRAGSNGYASDLIRSQVDVYTCDEADASCAAPYDGDSNYIQVVITSHVDTSFARVLGIPKLHNRVQALAMAAGSTESIPLFGGNGVVGLAPTGLSFHTTSNATNWNIYGGGLFANNNAQDKHGRVSFPDGHCATTVGSATGFTCPASTGNSDLALIFPDDIIPLLPPIPACDGVAYRGGDGKLHEQVGKEGRGSVVDHIEDNYAPGVYCITNANGNIHSTISGTGVTFYIVDTSFTLKFNGGGGWAVQAPTSGPYKGVLMFSNVTTTACSQNLEFRGNGSGDNVGTIFMPSACIDARGNSGVKQNRSQIIGYVVSSNGSGTVNVYYNPDDNYTLSSPPQVSLVH